MTVSSQTTYVLQLLNDTGNYTWQNATHIVPALNAAQEEFVMKIIAIASRNKKAYGMLSELHSKISSASIATTGYDMTGVDSSAPFVRNGLIAVECTLDSVTRWADIIDPSELSEQQNSYYKGNDERPVAYEFGEKIYLNVSTGSYPVAANIYYVRRPKELIESGASGYQATTCELDVLYHRLIGQMAAGICWNMLGDESSVIKGANILKSVDEKIGAILATRGAE